MVVMQVVVSGSRFSSRMCIRPALSEVDFRCS